MAQCQHWHPNVGIVAGRHKQCENEAIYWLIPPHGKPNPGGLVCRKCGKMIIKEMGEKLNEAWVLCPVDENGTRLPIHQKR